MDTYLSADFLFLLSTAAGPPIRCCGIPMDRSDARKSLYDLASEDRMPVPVVVVVSCPSPPPSSPTFASDRRGHSQHCVRSASTPHLSAARSTLACSLSFHCQQVAPGVYRGTRRAPKMPDVTTNPPTGRGGHAVTPLSQLCKIAAACVKCLSRRWLSLLVRGRRRTVHVRLP